MANTDPQSGNLLIWMLIVMELENIVANTVYLKAREGKSFDEYIEFQIS